MPDVPVQTYPGGHLCLYLHSDKWQASPPLLQALGLNGCQEQLFPLEQFWSLVYPQDSKQLRSTLAAEGRTGAAGKAFISRGFRLKPLGKDAWVQASIEGFLETDADGRAVTLTGTLILQRADTALVDRALPNYSGDMLAIVDCNLYYLAVNNAYSAMFGEEREFFIGRTVRQAFAHDEEHYDTVIHPSLLDCLQGKTVRFRRWVEVPRFGNLFLDIEYKPFLDEHGNKNGIAIVGRDRTEVMRTIEALQHSESMLKRTESIANLGGWFYDFNKDEMHWTDEMYAIHEVGKDFIPTTDNISSFFSPEDQPKIEEWARKIFSGSSGEEFVSSLITTRGNSKWIRSIAFPIVKDGKVVSVEGILQDITELTNMQHRIQQSEEKYRNLVEETNALVWEATFGPLTFHYMSPQCLDVTGYTYKQWCKSNFIYEHIHPDDLKRVLDKAISSTEAGTDFVLEYRLRKADGTWMWIHDDVKVIKDEKGKPVKIRGVMIDITQIKEMQSGLNRALRSLENHKYILDQHAIVNSTDPQGNINYVNEKFIEISGYEREELLGQNHRILKSGLHSRYFYQKMWDTICSGQVWQGEICNRKKDGGLYWTFTTIVPIIDEKGTIESFMAVRTDTTELKKTEESLRRAQKMEAIGQLTGGIAHDFNNLLSIVIGNLELMELVLPYKDRIRSQLENAKNAAMRGSVLTRRLLNFSHQTPVQAKALDLNKVMRSLEVLVSKSLTALVRVEMDLADDLWPVEVDPGDFEDVVINLSINASDAMPQGGKLRFSTCNHETAHMEFRNNGMIPPGKYVEVCVEDTGVGMPADVIEKIFEPYFSTKPSDKGSGLGLAMVYGFVQRSKGLIFVDSTPGLGTRFTIYLPKSAQEPVRQERIPDQRVMEEQASKSNETILLVDDEEDILKITRTNLECLGYRVICSTSGEDALQVLQSAEIIDLMFTDIVMPGNLNGYELAEEAVRIRPHLKLLFTTGYAKVENKVDREDWHNALIQKPYRSGELSKKIRETLDR